MNTHLSEKEISELMLKYNFALQMLETQINILIKDFEFNNKYNPVEHIKSRIKTEESVIDKLNKKGYEITRKNILLHIHDMIGVRIVCTFLNDVYDIIDMIKNSKQFKIKDEKDYIKNPKSTGYMSYHIIILVPIYLNETIEYVEAEVQIRTLAMDFWASIDHKVQYKFPSEIPENVKREMYNCSIDIKYLDEKMRELSNIVNKYNEND